ncbi:CPBP family intramembrane glutamic endopeptidase [Vallitalea sp.]|jgi:membrane protease YdiL (CAAX protease family)|uniref:CPBP family intramembrane glutamic endopeptidase n=1 Tax=Vallitalea sp. TaxID=1882829 RepID=UPI0025D12BFB|nr:CPBP family intramembrane glutamic endopeptidase [Vallitalea sp.]MCT4686191.1 CPBP family intramembrane metalloprotease [Vallitalea sp.]
MNSTKRGNKFILILIIIILLVPEIIAYLELNFNFKLTSISTILIPQLGLIGIPVILYFIITKQSIKKTLMFKKLDIINVLLAIGIGLLIQPLLSLINLISQIFFENKISGTIFTLAELPLWLLLLLVAVLPAINEEIVTRGILLTNYKNVNIFKAALISGLSFGMLHMNANQFSYAFVMGIILFILVKITGSIFSSMLIHFLINGLQMVIAKLAIFLQEIFGNSIDYDMIAQEAVSKDAIISLLPIPLILTFITLPLVFLLFYAAVKHNKKEYLFVKSPSQEIEPIKSKDKIFDVYLISSIIIFIAHVVIKEILVI